MSKVIGVAILLILGFAGWRFAAYYREVNRQIEQRNNRWEQTSPPAESPRMPSALEPSLAAAKTKGGLRVQEMAPAIPPICSRAAVVGD